ncbi:hypothetical protein [Deinococcus sonorensis]|uniref:Uncharacterized protein n=2 Tax=Deinococcus sonorensis TaxID=309891 RepID=A0AAU7UDD7_9DEIO
MTEPNTDIRQKARRVLGLYRGAQGGERQAAAGALRRLLTQHDLYLDQLEPGLPHSQDPAALDNWRASLGLLAQLGTPDQEAALLQLIEAEDLTPPERARVLSRISVPLLVQSRAVGWAHESGDPDIDAALLTQAGRELDPAEIEHDVLPITQSIRRLALQHAWTLSRPERHVRASSRLDAEFIAGVVEGLTRRRPTVQDTPEHAVLARLSPGELSRLRTVMAQRLPQLEQQLSEAARRLGRSAGQEPI